jgi:hypothetical protein
VLGLAALQEDIEHIAVLIDGRREKLMFALNRQCNLIRKPMIIARSTPGML